MDWKKRFFVQNREVNYRQIGPSSLLNHRGDVFELNTTAADVWQALKEPRSLEELLELLAREYDIERDTLQGDIRQWLEEAAQRGIVQINETR